jgi:lipid II:glycine glycyltransferase (peptidoglycan interpeptide bridge formation enzyme)
MNVFEIDPTADQRWDSFVQGNLQASIFHTRAWLQTLQQTYGYKPRAVVIAQDESRLSAAIPFCEVTGFFGKRRLVSLPFSDHCQPLFDTQEQLQGLTAHLRAKRDAEKWDYLELRPTESIATTLGLEDSERFVFHRLSLRRNPEEIFASLHKDCVQRKIKRAEKTGLAVEEGTTDALLKKFYRLLVLTRRQHGLPAQPTEWFKNLAAKFGSNLTISVASSAGHPIAGIITIRHNRTVVYKYGGADHRFRSLGGMHLLLWRAIQLAMRDGLREFDLGRSDITDSGLVTFKDRWGAEQRILSYRRYGAMPSTRLAKAYQSSIGKYVWAHTPKTVLTAAGRVLYRQLG